MNLKLAQTAQAEYTNGQHNLASLRAAQRDQENRLTRLSLLLKFQHNGVTTDHAGWYVGKDGRLTCNGSS